MHPFQLRYDRTRLDCSSGLRPPARPVLLFNRGSNLYYKRRTYYVVPYIIAYTLIHSRCSFMHPLQLRYDRTRLDCSSGLRPPARPVLLFNRGSNLYYKRRTYYVVPYIIAYTLIHSRCSFMHPLQLRYDRTRLDCSSGLRPVLFCYMYSIENRICPAAFGRSTREDGR